VRAKAAPTVHKTEALVLRRVEFGEADLILTLLTRSLGRVSALARGARRNSRRFAGALEPFFTLGVILEERRGVELMTLREATLLRPRTGLLTDLAALSAAGRVLGWVRRAAPVHTPEPEAWKIVEDLLDRLAAPGALGTAEPELARAGLRLLGAFGWALELERCVRCGKPCPVGRPASLDPVHGGLVCRECGGGRLRLPAALRERLLLLNQDDVAASLSIEEASFTLDLIERVFDAHAGEA
jgi:DNA repair protein RecO (recombination protein O)